MKNVLLYPDKAKKRCCIWIKVYADQAGKNSISNIFFPYTDLMERRQHNEFRAA